MQIICCTIRKRLHLRPAIGLLEMHGGPINEVKESSAGTGGNRHGCLDVGGREINFIIANMVTCTRSGRKEGEAKVVRGGAPGKPRVYHV